MITKTNRSVFALVDQLNIQLQAAMLSAQLSINQRFDELKEEAEQLKAVEPSFTLPWETYTPPTDQRRYQVENCMDAILKVLPRTASKAITSKEVIRRIKALHLSYADATIYQTLCTMKQNLYTDNKGYCIVWDELPNEERENLRGRPGSIFWKVKA